MRKSRFVLKPAHVGGGASSDLTRYVAKSKPDRQREGDRDRPLFTEERDDLTFWEARKWLSITGGALPREDVLHYILSSAPRPEFNPKDLNRIDLHRAQSNRPDERRALQQLLDRSESAFAPTRAGQEREFPPAGDNRFHDEREQKQRTVEPPVRARDEKVTQALTEQLPVADRERPLTRVEELSALYALRSLTAEAAEFDGHRAKIDEEMSRLAPTERERAVAIDTLGARLARSYRVETARLKAFEAAEAERARLADEAFRYESSVRAGLEFQLLLKQEREQERDRSLTEREALIRAGNARYQTKRDGEESRSVSNYPELVGEQPVFSPYAEIRQTHDGERCRARAMLVEKLTDSDVEHARDTNLAEIQSHQDYFRRLTGREVSSAEEARAALAPQLERARTTLIRLRDERAQEKIERTRTPEKATGQVFVGLGANASDRIEAAALFLRSSQEPERRQLGEILQTFRAMKVSRAPEEGQLRFQITTPANSELGRAEWMRLLDHMPSLIHAARGARLPEAQRGRITRAALDLAWGDVEAVGRQHTERSTNRQSLGEADDLREAIERGANSQQRARIAADALKQVTARDDGRLTQFNAYAAQTKAEYLESFTAIDEQLGAFGRDTRQDRAVERREAFRPVRGQMETKIAAYLTGVVNADGLTSLEREAAHHTVAVSRVIKETLQKQGYELATFDLNDDSVNLIAGKLIEELPGAIRDASRDREQIRDREHGLDDISRRDHLLPGHAHERSAALHTQGAPDGRGQSSARQPATSARLHQPDDEFVEQRVNRIIGQIQERALSHTLAPSNIEQHPSQHRTTHAPDIADTREQQAHRYTLTR